MIKNKAEKPELVCHYKGKRFLLLYNGKTKLGERALLMLFDASRKFWVDSSEVSDIEEKREEKKVSKKKR